jgi:CTP synthase
MTTKYIFVLGGVVSGLGKGITAASLGRLLKSRGLKVTMQKLDPYLNIDPGSMDPLQHGEVFVTDDGAETDLDIGHYERFIDENLNKHSNYTSGKIYNALLENERNGVYEGATVQMIPHVTNMIKDIIRINAKSNNADIAIVEIGGTVGDYESLPHMEAIRQFSHEEGFKNCMYIHVALIPFLTPSDELKTKPAQHSVKELLSLGIQPDILVCRSDRNLGADIRQKLSLFCNVPYECVIQNINLGSLYDIPLALEEEGLAEQVIKRLHIQCHEKDLREWEEMVERSRQADTMVKIGIVGKYTDLHDAYLSVVEALKHAAIFNAAELKIVWLNSYEVTEKNAEVLLENLDGILVPGGFGEKGIEGKIIAARFARENKIPYLGLGLGLQVAVIEFARHVANITNANSREINPDTTDPVIDFLPEPNEYNIDGRTFRLGKFPCKLKKDTKTFEHYKTEIVFERHRHLFEVNNQYLHLLIDKGMIVSGISPNETIVEIIELPNHPWFVACQFHPEFKSRPNRPHPLFTGFVKAAIRDHL